MGKALFLTGCPQCGDLNPVDGFRKPNGKSRPWCNLCKRKDERSGLANIRYQKYYEKNKTEIADRKRLKFYNVTAEEFVTMVVAQKNECPLCLKKVVSDEHRHGWVFDHDHECCPPGKPLCGKCTRGLICHNCNKAMGLLKDSVDTLLRMVAYLEKT